MNNHIAILLDKSESMTSLAKGVIDQYNQQAALISKRSASEGQKTFLSLYTFSTFADQPILVEVPTDLVELKPLTLANYQTKGMTAMLDSIGLAVKQLSQFNREKNDSYLIVVITDGIENNSNSYVWKDIENLIRTKIGTDMWSFVFLVPPGNKIDLIRRLGISDGNVLEWNQTEKGVREYSEATARGFETYFAARSQGQTSVKNFFTASVTADLRKLSNILPEVTTGFIQFPVSQLDNGIDIKSFCHVNLGDYVLGNGFYQLTKSEEVQAQKEIVIEHKYSGKMYGGKEARKLLGLPDSGTVHLHPDKHSEYTIYVQSTSVNRKLVGGTKFLYKK